MQGSPADDTPAPLRGGQLLAAISNRVVGMLREHYGRGPINAKTYALDDMIVVVLRGSGFTRHPRRASVFVGMLAVASWGVVRLAVRRLTACRCSRDRRPSGSGSEARDRHEALP